MARINDDAHRSGNFGEEQNGGRGSGINAGIPENHNTNRRPPSDRLDRARRHRREAREWMVENRPAYLAMEPFLPIRWSQGAMGPSWDVGAPKRGG